jgi:hypothetical protein
MNFGRYRLAVLLGISGTLLPATLPAQTGEDLLRTTRWNIASYLYLLNYGRYDRAASEANIDYAARLGFNAIRFNVWWHEIIPDTAAVKAGGNWAGLDHNVDYAVGKGLKVILTVSLRAPATILFTPEDCVVDSEQAVDTNWDKTTRMSFSSPRFGRAIRFVQQVGERYKDRQNTGHLLAIAPLVTREAEIAYAHDRLEDFNPAFIREFRGWLESRYDRQIVKLNGAWGSQHKTFGEVPPPRSFGGMPGRDWYRFRDLKARQFVDSCAAALSDIHGLTVPYRLLLDYGNVGDPMAWKRGSLSFGFHAAHPMVWGVKHNDAHDYDQAYTGSLLGSTMRQLDKLAFNEWFYDKDRTRYPSHDVIGDSCREIRAHYDQGMNGVSYVGVHPPNPDLETIIARLKAEGIWTAPVTQRRLDQAPAGHVKLSTLLGLNGWEIKQRYFDPQFRAGHRQVHVVIDDDFTDPLLPIIRPSDYGAQP